MAGVYHSPHFAHKAELRIAKGPAERVYWIA